MSKFSQWKEAIKNPPEERLCLISANASKLNILGMIVVILFLVNFGVWYISLLFVFNIIINWVGYKREIKKHNTIIEAQKAMGIYKPIEDDISFTRRRLRTIKEYIGEWIMYTIIAIISLIMWFCMDPASKGWAYQVLFVVTITFIFLIVYLFPVYWVAKWKGNRRKKK